MRKGTKENDVEEVGIDPIAALARGFKTFKEAPPAPPPAHTFVASAPSRSQRLDSGKDDFAQRQASQLLSLSAPPLFWQDVRGEPSIKDGHGLVRPEAFSMLDRPPDAPLVLGWTSRQKRRADSRHLDEATPLGVPPKKRYFRRGTGVHDEAGMVRVSDQQSWSAAVSAAAEKESFQSIRESRTSFSPHGELSPPFYLPLFDPKMLILGKQSPTWGAICRHERHDLLHARCQKSPKDVQAWLDFAEFQWAKIGEGVAGSSQQVREQQCAIIESALQANPGDLRLLRALARAEVGTNKSVDAASLTKTRWSRFVACGVADAAEELVWSYLEAAALATGEESMTVNIRQAAVDVLKVLAGRKIVAGHDGKAIVALERAELAAISAVAFAETGSGRSNYALTLLRGIATLNVFFPQTTEVDAAFLHAWGLGFRIGGPGALYMLQSLRLVQGAWDGAGPGSEIPPTLAPLADLIEAATAAEEDDKFGAVAAQKAAEKQNQTVNLAGLLASEGKMSSDRGRLRSWAAAELLANVYATDNANEGNGASSLTQEPSIEDLQPLLVCFRTDGSRKEALFRLLDALGSSTLSRHSASDRYRVAFSNSFAPIALRPFRGPPDGLSASPNVPTLSGGLPVCAKREALMARAVLQGLVAWPNEPMLLEALLEALWHYGSDGKLPKRVLRASEDPRLYFGYGRGLWTRGNIEAARAVFLRLCSAATHCDARVAVAWWHLELRREAPLLAQQFLITASRAVGGVVQPPRALRVLLALANQNFVAEELLSSKPIGAEAGLQCLQAAARLRRALDGRNRSDAGGCRFLLSSYHAMLVAACALESRRSPRQAWSMFCAEWHSQALGGPAAHQVSSDNSAKATKEENRCWGLGAGILIELLSLCPGASPGLVLEAIRAALDHNPCSPWLLRALAAIHLRRGTLAAMRRDLDRALSLHRPTSLMVENGGCSSVRALQVAFEAELAANAIDNVHGFLNRLVTLSELAHSRLSYCPFAGPATWALHETALLLRGRMLRDADVIIPTTSEREERWRVAVRGVRRYPMSKVMWVLQLAAWESRSDNPDEEELIDFLEAMSVRNILLHSDPLEAIA